MLNVQYLSTCNQHKTTTQEATNKCRTDIMCKPYLEIKRFIAVKNKNKAAKLIAKCFHWLSFTRASRSCHYQKQQLMNRNCNPTIYPQPCSSIQKPGTGRTQILGLKMIPGEQLCNVCHELQPTITSSHNKKKLTLLPKKIQAINRSKFGIRHSAPNKFSEYT